MPSAGPKLFFIAGEPSGDARAAAVLRAIRERAPGVEAVGLGGPRLAAAGMRLLRDMTVDMAIVGLVEVFKKSPQIVAVRSLARRALREMRPDALVLVDYPGFNLGLMAPYARKLGIPVVYYIVPQFWAWHQSRIHRLRRFCRTVIPIFPFEEALLREEGIDARFVGNPLLDDLRADIPRETVCPRFGLDPTRPVVGLLPGSRRREVAKHLPLMLQAAKRITDTHSLQTEQIQDTHSLQIEDTHSRHTRDTLLPSPSASARPPVQWVVVRAATIRREFLDDHLRNAEVPVTVLDPPGEGGVSPEEFFSMRAAFAFAWVKSGTSTLETALLGTPFVVVYKVSPLTAFIGRRVMRVPFMGMPNLVAGEEVVPELIQENLTVDGLARHALRILTHPGEALATRERLRAVRERFGPPGSAGRAAEIILETAGEGR
ncbi:MAG: hypothetical protein KA419_12625 [Acidobacteria bacterium]|nr:hypothetical protein [Acidobacteriota bacterium]